MLDSSHLVAFAPTTDMAATRDFYGATLGLRLTEENPFACVFDANGTTLRVTLVDGLTPAPFTILGWVVTDIAAVIGDLAGRGVVFQRFEGMAQDQLGAWTTPGGDRVAWFKDPDGNTLSLTELRLE
jgi:catechol 2,3-dioxygenase-like lactoylglutathione lyase family enzyme